jgi:hypothetical protein
MNYIKLYFYKNNQTYYLNHQISMPLTEPITWIYCLLNSSSDFPELYQNTEWNLRNEILHSTFSGQTFNDELSLELDHENNYFYIYYNNDSTLETELQKNIRALYKEEITVFHFLNNKNSLKISKKNLIEILSSWEQLFSMKNYPKFILLWQDQNEWIYLESFDTQEAMDQRTQEIKK